MHAGLMPFRDLETGKLLLAIKLPKEGILATRVNGGFKIYVAPLQSTIGFVPALVPELRLRPSRGVHSPRERKIGAGDQGNGCQEVLFLRADPMVLSDEESGALPIATIVTLVDVKPAIHQIVLRNHRIRLGKCESV
jgi:hypothetical protein